MAWLDCTVADHSYISIHLTLNRDGLKDPKVFSHSLTVANKGIENENIIASKSPIVRFGEAWTECLQNNNFRCVNFNVKYLFFESNVGASAWLFRIHDFRRQNEITFSLFDCIKVKPRDRRQNIEIRLLLLSRNIHSTTIQKIKCFSL